VCHDPHASDNKSLLTAAKINDLCFTCHQDDATKRKWVHKPIQEKGCTACHDPHGGDYKFNLSDAEGNDLCLKCHTGVATKVKFPHRAVVRYGCIACHDPHASDNEKGLVRATNELCVSCHQDHPDGSHTGGPHKVEGSADPKRPGRPFSCASCHNPHGSDNPKLFYAGASREQSCKYCHTNPVATGGSP
jgi:predicted CXXCH cytochrome family protein